MTKTDDIIVKIYRGVSGWHYHKPECPYAQSTEYETFTLRQVQRMKTATDGKYQQCACIKGEMPVVPWIKK